jgi:two-component system, LuxR family, response regulator FixJ
MSKPTVFIVDDDPDMRDSLASILISMHLPVETFASAEDFLAKFNPAKPGCLVLDMRMPGMSGMELQAKLKERGRALPVIIITGFGDVPMAVACMKHGAIDFIEKPFRAEPLLASIRRALELDTTGRASDRLREEARAKLASLSPREMEVLDGLVLGKGVKEIAGDFGLSYKTVQTHRAHIMEKTGIESLAELVRLWLAADFPKPGQ